MAWKIRNITGTRRLNEDMRLEPIRLIEFTVDNPQNPDRPFGPFTLEVAANATEQQMRELIEAEAQKVAGLARGG